VHPATSTKITGMAATVVVYSSASACFGVHASVISHATCAT
jgi:hypothetical protein